MIGAPIPDTAPRVIGWTHACLPCNATWRGDEAGRDRGRAHVCANAAEYRRGFWIDRLRWAMPKATALEIAAVVGAPIARTELVQLLGDRWGG